MDRIASNARAARFTLCSAMVAALLAGCAGQPPLAGAGAPVTDAPHPAGVADKALAKAEARVARSADSAAARVELAQLYLAAGRFDSAATTFADAVSLGDRSPRTGLGLALAYIGSGRSAQALQVLAAQQGQIPAGDFGLAIALAGQPAQGVEVLSAALRGGENDPKLRQNLAYAYALDGRWAEARLIAAQDVPADQLDARLREWASHARPEQAPVRVAGLLGTPLRADPGQPAALALNGGDSAPRLAVAAVPAPAPAPAELPAAETGETFWGANQSEPAVAAASYEAPAPTPKPTAAPTRTPAPAPAPALAKRTSIERAFAPVAAPRGGQGGHLVQLGSFATREGAQRAWGIFLKRNPALRDHALRITEARVNGRTYFRVAAEGFDRGSAQALCSGVKQHGGACLAYADDRARPGAAAGPRLARGR